MNWRNSENDGVYLFFHPFGFLKFGMIVVKQFANYETWLEILHITHFFFLGISSEWVVFYLVLNYMLICGIMQLSKDL